MVLGANYDNLNMMHIFNYGIFAWEILHGGHVLERESLGNIYEDERGGRGSSPFYLTGSFCLLSS